MKYFETSGKENVDETLKLAKKKGKNLGIGHVTVASTSGFTAEKALDVFKDTDTTLTIVGIDPADFNQNVRETLEEEGHNVRFSQEVSYKYPELVKSAYRRFCEGVKVAVEIPMIAADENLIPTDEEVVSVGKWDTAVVIKPAKSDSFSNLEIKELICKPR